MGNDSFTGIPSKDKEGINDGVRWVMVNGVGVDTPDDDDDDDAIN